MSLTLEQLKKEVGQIKTTNLSYKKYQLECVLNIYSNNEVVGKLPVRIRYKNEDNRHYPIKDAVFNKLSMKYGIKKKSISIKFVKLMESVDGFCPIHVPFSVVFDDDIWYRSWNRESKLNELFTQSY